MVLVVLSIVRSTRAKHGKPLSIQQRLDIVRVLSLVGSSHIRNRNPAVDPENAGSPIWSLRGVHKSQYDIDGRDQQRQKRSALLLQSVRYSFIAFLQQPGAGSVIISGEISSGRRDWSRRS